MSEAELPGLTARALWAAFGLAVAFGAVARRTHFCTMGAIGDIVSSADWSRMRMWVLAIGSAMMGFNTMVAAGWVQAGDSLYATPRFVGLSNALGGLLFGFGMVLASGCGSRNVVRAGGGNLKSWVVLLVLAVSAEATMRGITGVLRVATVDAVAPTLPTGQDLPSLLAPVLGLPRNWLAFVAPLAYTLDWLTLFSDKNRVLRIGTVAMAGVLLGSAIVALAEGSFRLEGFAGREDTANHLVGGALTGVGGVTALGCTIGQGISGVSTLAIGSCVALAGIVAGGWLGLRWQTWRVERMA